MNGTALAAAALASLVASFCALADGALLSFDDELAPSEPTLRSLYDNRERVHRTLSFARVIGHLTAGAGVALAFGLRDRPFGPAAGIALLAAIVAVTLTESVARALGDALGPGAILQLRALVSTLGVVLAPATFVAGAIDARLRRSLPVVRHGAEEREATAEQFRQVVATEADVSRDEEELLRGVFSLGDTEVNEVMVPRIDIVGIDRTTPWSEVLDRVRSSEHARFPVFDNTLDEIAGVLYAKDLLPAVIGDEAPEAGWPSLVRPAVFIPGTKPLDAQLRDFKTSGTHIAIVVDEYGGTAGLVTIEDVLEEIVGEIHDEYDVKEPDIEQREGRRFWVSGRLTLDELSDALDHDFTRDDISTVGGLVYERLGRVPRAGESLTIGTYRVVVERVKRRTVERVYFERIETPDPEET